MAAANVATPEDPAVPARSAETEEALQPVPIPDWSLEAGDWDSIYLEYCSVEQDHGPQSHSLTC